MKNKPKKQTAFVLIHSNIRPFLHYDSPKHDRSAVCRTFIVSNRKDNTKGFIGGTVDEGESIIDGLVREIDEEYSFDLDRDKLSLLSTNEDDRMVSHLFDYEVDEVTFFEILHTVNKNFTEFFQKNIAFLKEHHKDKNIENLSREKFGVSHYFCETRSIEAIYITDRKYDMENLFKTNFIGFGKEEVKLFLDKYQINYEG